ncbi:MAG: alpha-D-ribose 1-methylphosphonate 5-triphosphate diphosphatase [Cyanobacteria bacterium P01_G01_bin.38]
MPSTLAIQGAQVLTPQGWLPDTTVLVDEGRFAAIAPDTTPPNYPILSAKGLHLLPGIVDIHGDAFERMICPRPGVSFPLEIALVENDRALLSAGITTFYYSITDSFEPGLRSREMARQIIQAVQTDLKPHLKADSRIHIRHEQSNTDQFEELCNWISQGQAQLISLNDHLPPTMDDETLYRYTQGLRQRIKLSEGEIRQLIEAAFNRRDLGRGQTDKLVQYAHAHHIPLASHDDETSEEVALSLARGVAIAEFPAKIDLAAQHKQHGTAILMGAPNLLRGGSHVGYMGVAEAAQTEVVDCLCSDYHYPSLLHAPFKLAEMDLMAFETAWQLVSTNPARAAKIDHQKGAISPGLDADFLLMDLSQSPSVALKAVYVKGKKVLEV